MKEGTPSKVETTSQPNTGLDGEIGRGREGEEVREAESSLRARTTTPNTGPSTPVPPVDGSLDRLHKQARTKQPRSFCLALPSSRRHRHPRPHPQQSRQTDRSLTEQQDMRMLHRQLRKHNPIPQPITQLLDRRGLVRSTKTEPTKLGSPCLSFISSVLFFV
jgi:hypothetical protein